MKPITFDQWARMNSRQRSWIVCKIIDSFGYHPLKSTTYWSAILPNGEQLGGSYQSCSWVHSLIQRAKEMLREYERWTSSKGSSYADAKWRKTYPDNQIDFVRRWAECTVHCSACYPLFAELDHTVPELINYLIANRVSVRLTACADKSPLFRIYCRAGVAVYDFAHGSLAHAVTLAFVACHGLLIPSPRL